MKPLNKKLMDTAYWVTGAIALMNVVVICFTPDEAVRSELYFTALLALGVLVFIKLHMVEAKMEEEVE